MSARRHPVPAAVLLGAAVVVAIGCGRSPTRLETVPVAGRVTLDGRPVAAGTVLLVPARGRAGQGSIAADGRFAISTYRSADGGVVGDHRVAVFAAAASPKTFAEDVAARSWLVPERYANPETSGLSCTLVAGQAAWLELALVSEPP